MIANNMYPALSLAPVVIVCSNLAPLTTYIYKDDTALDIDVVKEDGGVNEGIDRIELYF